MQSIILNNITDCYVGNTRAMEIWYSSTKIWPSTPPHDYSQDYLTFTALEPTTFSFNDNNLLYSLDDGQTWTTLIAGTSTPQLSTGDNIFWKQTNPQISGTNGIGTFSSTGNFDVSGNIMSLYHGDNFIIQTDLTGKTYAFSKLFYNCTGLFNTENLILPATTLASGCYYKMFGRCTSLITTPELPATTLASGCYNDMFYYCISLTTAPELPATTLSPNCYDSMFSSCHSLTTAPELPATTLRGSCYQWMFSNCTSLTTAPELPATTLVDGCYFSMFISCTNLNYVKCLATNINAIGCTTDWLQSVSSTGTFVKDANTTWPINDDDGIPSGWTIHNA